MHLENWYMYGLELKPWGYALLGWAIAGPAVSLYVSASKPWVNLLKFCLCFGGIFALLLPNVLGLAGVCLLLTFVYGWGNLGTWQSQDTVYLAELVLLVIYFAYLRNRWFKRIEDQHAVAESPDPATAEQDTDVRS